MINTIIASHFGKDRFHFILQVPITVHSWEKTMHPLKPNLTDRMWNTDRGGELLTALLSTPCSTHFLYNPWLPAQGGHCLQRAGPHTWVINQEKASAGFSNSHRKEAFFQEMFSHPRGPSLCQGDRNPNQNKPFLPSVGSVRAFHLGSRRST